MATLTPGDPGFLYLNRDNGWLDFERHGLEIVNGALRLAVLPALVPPVTVTNDQVKHPGEAAGIAVAPDGSVYIVDPASSEIIRVDGCDECPAPLPCLGGEGDAPTTFVDPRGLAVHPGRHALLVADAGNHRVQLFDLETGQLLDIWGDAGPYEPVAPSAEPGRFDTPVDLTVDGEGLVYVVDQGNRRVQQFTAGGEVIPRFWERLAAAGVALTDPVNIAFLPGDDGGQLFILDRTGGQPAGHLVIADPSGAALDDRSLDLPGQPLGLAVTDDALFVGVIAQPGRVMQLRHDGAVVGVCLGYAGPIAGLALDLEGRLLVHPGWAAPPLRFTPNAAFLKSGFAYGGPFGGFAPWTKQWHSLTATMAALPKNAHVTSYVATGNNPQAKPAVTPNDVENGPFPVNVWSAGPPDLETFLLDRPEQTYSWVGIRCTSEGASTPTIEQIRLDFDRKGYLSHLPAMYREDAAPNAFLRRYLALVEQLFGEVEGEIDGLSGLLDPAGTRSPFQRELARWLGLEISPDWDDAALRDAIASAYAEAANRGTARGLRAALRRFTGVDALIEEPIRQAAWWALATPESPVAEQETSLLGVSTRLVAAEPQGAVLGSTATIDRSHLIASEEFGTPLFEGVAHRFMVRLHQGTARSPERLAAVTALIEREKPAHTDYRLCVIEPGLTIGGDRIGIESVLGGEALPSRSGDARLGIDARLGGELPGQIGERSEIGVTTLLGPTAAGD